MNISSKVIEVKNLCKDYEVPILNDINFSLKKNEFISIIGQSGTGKSTIFDSICNLIEYRGTIKVDGEIGYVNQKNLLLPWMTLKNNFKLFTKLSKLEFNENDKALKLFGIDTLLDKYPKMLSGGEKQRASLYRNYITNKSIWLLDEPFAGLDLITKEKMYKWLKTVIIDLNVSVLFISHDIRETIYLSDKILILKGRPASISKIILKKDFDFNNINSLL